MNPFQKDISEIVAIDLSVLRQVSEGWYVDYKRQIDKPAAIAKHLSSFANQFGGWLFVGVKENGSRFAEAFPGLPIDRAHEFLVQVREANGQHVQPEVYYEEKLVFGPCEEIGLSSDCAVVVIRVHESKNPPHLHSSGRIYRRLADQSSPKEETDRHLLDRLFQKGERENKLFLQSRRKRTSTYSTNEFPLVAILLENNIFNYQQVKPLSLAEFSRAVNDNEQWHTSVEMHTCHSIPFGFTAKHSKGNPLGAAQVQLDWYHSTNACLKVPLNFEPAKSEDSHLDAKYDLYSEFRDLLLTERGHDVRILDVNYLINVVEAILGTYLRLIVARSAAFDLRFGFRLENVEGCVPFVNDEEYLRQLSEMGIPVVEFAELDIPPEFDRSSFSKLNNDRAKDVVDCVDDEERAKILAELSMPIYFNILNVLGVMNDTGDIGRYLRIYNSGKEWDQERE